ncbi:UNVERIFIED_CONTAM: hypothetical protein Sradi_2017000 [Sesamum radiatum]|uniref:Uncharacterized protein n=1 Tax=Sesamum radiatum TaxID=300843 RepID=A0AAW2THI1_SESRA
MEKSWNEEFVRAEFGKEDAECILSIELRNPETIDSLEWHFGRKGRLLISSAYDLYTQHLEEACFSSSHA